MRCANPKCSSELIYLRSGSVQLLEFEPALDALSENEDYEFSIQPSPRRFFWLCGQCSNTFVIKHWTSFGVVLETKNAPFTHKKGSHRVQDEPHTRAA